MWAVLFALPGLSLGACSMMPADNPGQRGALIPVIVQKSAPLPSRPRRLAGGAEAGSYWEIDSFSTSILKRRPELPGRSGEAALSGLLSVVAKYHVVKGGETLFSLSNDYAVTVRALVVANKLQEPYHLQAGQRLVIPAVHSYQVVRGDSVYGLSLQHKLSVKQLIAINGLEEPYQLYVGQEIIFPGAVEDKVTENESPATGPQIQSAHSIGQSLDAPHLPSSPKSRPLRTEQTQHLAFAPKRRLAMPQPAARASSRFLRPVRGKIVSSFGPKAGGIYNDGVNIAVTEGTGVRASENGVVVYAGNSLRGFGNMILLKHADGWLTAYAHNQKLLVAQGEAVKRGQPIALSGQTGSVEKPQLHFEIRRGEKALDPVNYMD